MLDWKDQPGFTVPVPFGFSVPLGKAYPHWSLTIQTPGLLFFPGKSPTNDKQAGLSSRQQEPRKGTLEGMHRAKETEEGDCLNEIH